MGDMPPEPWLWALAIVVGGAAVVVALIKGGVVEVSLDPPSLKFRRKAQDAQERVKVLEEAEIEQSKVGDITGGERAGESGPQPAGTREIEVGKGLTIKGSEVGDISGVKEGGSGEEKNPTKTDG